MRVLGLDFGEKRVGVAVSDPLGKTAQPLATLGNDEGLFERLAGIVKDTGAERIVVGLPLLMNGTEGSQAEAVRRFARGIESRLRIPVSFVDERLTTRQADAVISEAGGKPGELKGASDRIAAALILREYLDGFDGDTLG